MEENNEEDDFFISPIGYLQINDSDSTRNILTLTETESDMDKLPSTCAANSLTIKLSIMSISYSILCPAILSTPITMSFCGIIVAILTFFFIFGLSTITCYFVKRVIDETKAESFSSLGSILYNQNFENIINIVFIIYNFGICVTFLTSLRQYVYSFLYVSFDTHSNIYVYIISIIYIGNSSMLIHIFNIYFNDQNIS